MNFEGIIDVCIVASYGIVAWIFYRMGKKAHNSDIDRKIQHMHDLADELKERNNQFLKNVSEVYNHINGTEGQLSDIDYMLMDMWID